MDELGIDTAAAPHRRRRPPRHARPVRLRARRDRWEEVEKLAGRWPGRFAALALIDPTRGMRGVQRASRAHLADPWVVGCYLHTHSFDRRLDHADYYPFYAACADADVPVAMQAGTSGGLMASECGRADHASTAPRSTSADTRFVLSHLGVAVGRRGDRDGAEVPERLPRHRRVPASALADRGAAVPARARAAPRCCSAATSRPSGTGTRSARSPSSSSSPRSSRRCSAAPRVRCSPVSRKEPA